MDYHTKSWTIILNYWLQRDCKSYWLQRDFDLRVLWDGFLLYEYEWDYETDRGDDIQCKLYSRQYELSIWTVTILSLFIIY